MASMYPTEPTVLPLSSTLVHFDLWDGNRKELYPLLLRELEGPEGPVRPSQAVEPVIAVRALPAPV